MVYYSRTSVTKKNNQISLSIFYYENQTLKAYENEKSVKIIII